MRLALYLVPYLSRREFDVAIVYSALGIRMTPLLRLFGVFTIFSERNSGAYSKFDLLRKWPYLAAANIIVCNSEAASRNYARHGFNPHTIENAIAPPSVAKVGRTPRRSAQVLLVPGRIAPVKNQAILLKALPALDNIVSRVLFAGTVEDVDYLRELEDLSAAVGWGSRVKVLGFVTDMDSLYRQCDVVVLPSRAEGMPNVLLEALSREILMRSERYPK